MFTTYEEALQWIHARLRLGIKPGLKRMEWMMEKLDHPERRIKAIHIGGTNGKGSTVTYLRSILQAAHYKVGTFTSPYFEHFNERISINGTPLTDEELIKLTNIIKPLADELEETELGGPTEFEVITAMSFFYFARLQPVDIALYEVGLGGRFDSTNIIAPLYSVITSIGLDHTNILGDTYEEIAFEKAGIIKNGTGIITATKQGEALAVIEKMAMDKKAPFYRLGEQFTIENHHSIQTGERFTVQTPFQPLTELEISMLGQHQTENATLAVVVSQLLHKYYSFLIEEEHIRAGLKSAYWPGRFEQISSNPLIIMDGAHNEEGVISLTNELRKRYAHKKIRVIFAALDDKKCDQMIKKLDEVSDHISFVTFDYPRAAKAESLFFLSHAPYKQIYEEWQEAIDEQLLRIEQDEMLVLTGSLYFLSQIKPYLIGKLAR